MLEIGSWSLLKPKSCIVGVVVTIATTVRFQCDYSAISVRLQCDFSAITVRFQCDYSALQCGWGWS